MTIKEDLGNGFFRVEKDGKFQDLHRSIIEDSLIICFKSKERMDKLAERSRA